MKTSLATMLCGLLMTTAAAQAAQPVNTAAPPMPLPVAAPQAQAGAAPAAAPAASEAEPNVSRLFQDFRNKEEAREQSGVAPKILQEQPKTGNENASPTPVEAIQPSAASANEERPLPH